MSPEGKSLFHPQHDEDVEDCLSRRIDMFDDIVNHKADISLLVNRASEENAQLNVKQGIIMIQKLQYLRMAYLNVLNSNIDEPISFRKCCEEAIKQMSEIGVNVITNYRTIMIWNRIFRTKEIFPHPNYYIEMGKSDQPVFLETFPEVKLELNEWVQQNLCNLNCENIGTELKQNILPNTYQTYLQDCGLDNHQLSYHEFLKIFHLKSISDSTIWRWMKYLGFNYCDRKNNYFCDRHEHESNVLYRDEFIKKYFQYEKNTYRLVHLKEIDAIHMEKDNDNKLLENTFVEFIYDNQKMREYHVDTLPAFTTEKYTKVLSVKRDASLTRPLMIIGQDKTVFKQYSFSRKCWVGPGGETHLLPKSDGYSRMISGFVSRSFGVGLHLSKEELEKVNERRA